MKVEIKSKNQILGIDWDKPQLLCDDNKNTKKVYMTTGIHDEAHFEALAFHPNWDNPSYSKKWLKVPSGGSPDSWKVFEGELTLGNRDFNITKE